MSASVPLDSPIGADCPDCSDAPSRRLVCQFHDGWAAALDSDDHHGASDAGLNELIAANVAGELEEIASDLAMVRVAIASKTPNAAVVAGGASTRLAKIAAGIRRAMAQDRGSQGSSTGDGEDGTVHPAPTPWDPHDPEAGQ